MTAAMLETIPAPPARARVLDFACGTGSIAAALLVRCPKARVYLSDNDTLGVWLARAGHQETMNLYVPFWARAWTCDPLVFKGDSGQFVDIIVVQKASRSGSILSPLYGKEAQRLFPQVHVRRRVQLHEKVIMT
jgi:hypothetical protein